MVYSLPALSNVAAQILFVPATSASVERSFNAARSKRLQTPIKHFTGLVNDILFFALNEENEIKKNKRR